MTFEQAAEIARYLGFRFLADVRGLTNIKQAFPEARRDERGRLTGLYVQFRGDGSVYVGRTVDLDRRFRAHRERGVVTSFLGFVNVAEAKLPEREAAMIALARDSNLPLANFTGNRKREVLGDTPFIEAYDEEDVAAFLGRRTGGVGLHQQWMDVNRRADPAMRIRWKAFASLERSRELIDATAGYVATALIDPANTLGRFTVLDVSDAQSHDVVLRLRAPYGNLFMVRRLKKAPRLYYARFLINRRVFAQAGITRAELDAAWPWVVRMNADGTPEDERWDVKEEDEKPAAAAGMEDGTRAGSSGELEEGKEEEKEQGKKEEEAGEKAKDKAGGDAPVEDANTYERKIFGGHPVFSVTDPADIGLWETVIDGLDPLFEDHFVAGAMAGAALCALATRTCPAGFGDHNPIAAFKVLARAGLAAEE